MNKNKGFSLIELITVVAIMAVVATGIGITVFSQSSWKCRQAKDIAYNKLQQTRSEALAKNGAWMEICYENGQCVLKSSFDGDQPLGKQVEVYYYWQKGPGSSATSTGPVKINSSNSLVLTFSRGTGGFQTMKEGVSTSTDPSGNVTVSYTEAVGKSNQTYCSKIRITGKNGSNGYTFTLHPVTGKFECEKD